MDSALESELNLQDISINELNQLVSELNLDELNQLAESLTVNGELIDDIFLDAFFTEIDKFFPDEQLIEVNGEDENNIPAVVNDNLNLPDTPSPTQHDQTSISSALPLPSNASENISDEDECSSTNSSETHLNNDWYPCDIKDWDNTHIMKWILDLYDRKNYRYEDLNIHYFRDKTGSCLKDLEESFWKKIDSGRGSWLYKEAQCLITYLNNKSSTSSNYIYLSDEPTQINLPRKRGRPPKSNSKPRNKEKVGRIWEFLRDLLKDPEYCPKYIRWDNYENLEFRLVDPKMICEIWGQKKGKVISYEHFSRSIRHYYKLNKDDPDSAKAKILSVRDRRLVYKFNKDALIPEDYKQFLKY